MYKNCWACLIGHDDLVDPFQLRIFYDKSDLNIEYLKHTEKVGNLLT